jgi:hypothetical protein
MPVRSVREITPKSGRIIGGMALGGLCALAGAGIVVGILQTAGNPLWCVPGLVLVLLGVAIVLVMKRFASLRLLVSEDGIANVRLGGERGGRCYRVETGGWQPAL